MKPITKLMFHAALLCCVLGITAQDLNPGIDRWSIKTSLAENHRNKKTKLQKLLDLPNPITKATAELDDKRISKTVDGLKEGDVITTKGYLHLVALEKDSKKHRDGDYHIQLKLDSQYSNLINAANKNIKAEILYLNQSAKPQ